MSFNFPNSPTQGQTYTPVGGYQYVFMDGVWRIVENPQVRATAETRNRIVNGAFQISQENGSTTGSANGFYPADQWVLSSNQAFSCARDLAPADGYRIIHSPTAKATLVTSDLVYLFQNIEGIRTRDFYWGYSLARPVVLRFEAYANVGGTYSVSIRNGAGDRSYVAPFVLPSAVWTTFVMSIPGDTTGAWPIDTTSSMSLNFSMAVGPSYVGVNGWQAGNKLGAPSATNGIATTNTFYIRNIGLHLDPNNTGLAPAWQTPDEANELNACLRYYEKGGVFYQIPAAGALMDSRPFKQVMRIAPACAIGAASSSNISSLVVNSVSTTEVNFQASGTASGAYTSFPYTANARM